MAHHASASPDIVDDGVPPQIDYKAHESTYRGFLTLGKWAIGVTVFVLVALYFVIYGW